MYYCIIIFRNLNDMLYKLYFIVFISNLNLLIFKFFYKVFLMRGKNKRFLLCLLIVFFYRFCVLVFEKKNILYNIYRNEL